MRQIVVNFYNLEYEFEPKQSRDRQGADDRQLTVNRRTTGGVHGCRDARFPQS
jgi:hypothetical protein